MVPYSPPSTQHVEHGALVGPGPFLLPKVCMRCGASVSAFEPEQHTKVGTYSPLMFVGLFVGGLPGLLAVHLALRKRTELTYSLCSACLQARTQRSKALTGSIFGTAGVGLLAVASGLNALAMTAGVFLMVLVVWFSVARRVNVRTHWNKHHQLFVLTGIPQTVLRQVQGHAAHPPRMLPGPVGVMTPPPWKQPQGFAPHTPAPPSDGTDGTV